MRVKAFSRVGDAEPLCREASVVLVEDDNGTAVAVAVDIGNGMGCMAAHAGDDDFNDMLRALGFDRLTICTPYRLGKLAGG